MSLMLAFVLGCGLGAVYFGGLWLTIRGTVIRGRGLGLLAASRVVRLALLGLGLQVLSQGAVGPILVAMIGFWVVRLYLLAKLGVVTDAN